MRNLNNEVPNLFAPEAVVAEALNRAQAAPQAAQKDMSRRPELVAREFVKWCCGFGADFRNSPDITNLRFWCSKTSLKLDSDEVGEILSESHRLFGKKIEQITRKADASLPEMNTMSE